VTRKGIERGYRKATVSGGKVQVWIFKEAQRQSEAGLCLEYCVLNILASRGKIEIASFAH